MAKILGSICTSHVPAIGNAISRGLHQDPYWKPFFQGYQPVHAWLDQVKPDVAVVVFNDHGLNFFLDALPTFAIGAAPKYVSEDEGWGLPTLPPYHGDQEFSWHLIERLIDAEFDMTTCQEMKVDHAFINPLRLLWPDQNPPPLKFVPIAVNTIQHPLPKPGRCLALGQALGRAIASYPRDLRVVVMGTGGLSHQLEGARAGFINREFDQLCLDALVNDPAALTRYTIHDLVRLAGSQGSEIIMWLIARAALTGRVSELHRSYHIPISNTAACVQLLENA
jgi:protocatechuate 4,5-dioxygenase beta chain